MKNSVLSNEEIFNLVRRSTMYLYLYVYIYQYSSFYWVKTKGLLQSIDEKSFVLGVFHANTFKNVRGEVIKMPIYLQKIFYMDCQDQTKKNLFSVFLH